MKKTLKTFCQSRFSLIADLFFLKKSNQVYIISFLSSFLFGSRTQSAAHSSKSQLISALLDVPTKVETHALPPLSFPPCHSLPTLLLLLCLTSLPTFLSPFLVCKPLHAVFHPVLAATSPKQPDETKQEKCKDSL